MKTPQFSRSTLTIALCVALGATGLFALSQPSNAQAPKPTASPKASMTITTGKRVRRLPLTADAIRQA